MKPPRTSWRTWRALEHKAWDLRQALDAVVSLVPTERAQDPDCPEGCCTLPGPLPAAAVIALQDADNLHAELQRMRQVAYERERTSRKGDE